MYRCHPENIGEFTEVDYNKNFTYRKTKDAWALEHGLEHEIDMVLGVRFGNVKKTVAYVAIDEASDGSAVMQKWKIKKHIVFTKE